MAEQCRAPSRKFLLERSSVAVALDTLTDVSVAVTVADGRRCRTGSATVPVHNRLAGRGTDTATDGRMPCGGAVAVPIAAMARTRPSPWPSPVLAAPAIACSSLSSAGTSPGLLVGVAGAVATAATRKRRILVLLLLLLLLLLGPTKI
eukprot:NODE_19790_length_827_cov_4.282857.p1 GENE.NODE_19790_length_827_cov_4.282857~~NODE_19790_length_827_cov_4.282857.p1  ORF type:complete len:148 (+),score=31.52 NODE_19790_length_827_cov_4.282857:285-728(+)